ncbi:MAG: 30S ribosome-binding factor RbfA [Clostridia bacterium]|nr:30S ribosome-binding factor RbfA [Clostridia bacterium]
MAKYRQNRINDSVTQEVSAILREVKDPRVAEAMLTITSSDVTADLKYAKIYYSVYGEVDDKELTKGFKSVAPFVRSQLAKRLNLRITPELQFVRDHGVEHGADIAAILKSITPAADAGEAGEDDDDE